jgi:ribosomal protein S27AE
MKPTERQLSALRRIVWWRRAHWLRFPLSLVTILTLAGAYQKPGWWPYAIPPALSAGVYMFSWYRVNRARCPRCGDFFFAQKGPLGPMGTSFPLQRRCQHCGMAIRRPD